jgi:hypothetical protein
VKVVPTPPKRNSEANLVKVVPTPPKLNSEAKLVKVVPTPPAPKRKIDLQRQIRFEKTHLRFNDTYINDVELSATSRHKVVEFEE